MLNRGFLRLVPGLAVGLAATMVWSHGDVVPQAVNTDALPEVGEEWLTENPYRADKAGDEVWQTAIEVGASGYNQNCARCHGLGAVSGGLAPDVRYLEASEYGDEWYVERFQSGYTQDGITKMPAFGEILGQKAAWAIRTYIETRADDGALDTHIDRLKEIRDQLSAGTIDDPAAVRDELMVIASEAATASGAPVADSAARVAALQLTDDPASFKAAADTLTVGLSAAN
ncbi:cytochrome c-550 PedF [Tabrizicola sp.]|uniref:cytochrome c-550 PedF n=1 Tax=Tabrizicola sp. TaxID=2005166 RepID=UPI003F2F9806